MSLRKYIEDCSKLTAKVTGSMNSALARKKYTRLEVQSWKMDLREALRLAEIASQSLEIGE